ncbi:LYR motif-containing protein 2 [Apiospora marii]|uniref:LYR motif-containing protein 2 n=1 Tax=Apiospora marii TaxID=335849 RepID=UPI00312FFF96
MRFMTASRVASVAGRLSLRGIRSYATEASRRGGSGGRLGATLSLEHFLQRSKVLALYRTILRGTGHIQDATTRNETRGFARAEFERHRGVTDLGHIRYLLSTGKTEWETMERYIGGM